MDSRGTERQEPGNHCSLVLYHHFPTGLLLQSRTQKSLSRLDSLLQACLYACDDSAGRGSNHRSCEPFQVTERNSSCEPTNKQRALTKHSTHLRRHAVNASLPRPSRLRQCRMDKLVAWY